MKAPSVATLADFLKVDDSVARAIRELWFAVDDGGRLEELLSSTNGTQLKYPATYRWVRNCYISPFLDQRWRRTMALSAIGELVEGTYGLEMFEEEGVVVDYLNAGDTYSLTLLHRSDKPDQLVISSWGDVVEELQA